MADIVRTARGVAKIATPQEVEIENQRMFLTTDTGLLLVTDSYDQLCANRMPFGFTNPDLHRRIDNDPTYVPGKNYSMVHYDSDGNPYPQSVVIGVWDGINSYRTTTTYIHDEESTTCEIP